MSLLRALTVLAVALTLQAALGRFWPAAYRYVDLMLVPVVWYGIAGSQRSGMLVGCSAGLLRDAWFESGTFGLNGFKRTLLGWVLGGLGTRFDLNHLPGRLLAGGVISLVDSLMDFGLRLMLDQRTVAAPWEALARAVTTALLVASVFGLGERFAAHRRLRRPA